jgi:hypothetical protein
MKIAKDDYANSVVVVGMLARKLQNVSASNDQKAVYEIATDIMLECQHIREQLGAKTQPKSIADYIKRILP